MLREIAYPTTSPDLQEIRYLHPGLLGPALEAYGAHPYVKKTDGGVMTVEEFLREVRKLVLHFSLGELPGFRDVQKETQGRGESLEIDPVTQY